jgi:hypothetical protein
MTAIKESKKHLDVLHFEHERWGKQLAFYTDELKIYTNRLGEISNRYTDSEILAKLEQFQNKFIVQQDAIDTLAHDIKIHETKIMTEAQKNLTAVEHRFFGDHGGLRDRMETFVKLYNELKNE